MERETFKLLYDSHCPFCRREVQWLKRRDRKGLLAVEDIADRGFRAEQYGLTQEQVMGMIHGILPDGRVLSGMSVIRAAYRAAGVGWLMAPTGWPGIRWVADRLYRLFARNRVRLGRFAGGRCESGACKT